MRKWRKKQGIAFFDKWLISLYRVTFYKLIFFCSSFPSQVIREVRLSIKTLPLYKHFQVFGCCVFWVCFIINRGLSDPKLMLRIISASCVSFTQYIVVKYNVHHYPCHSQLQICPLNLTPHNLTVGKYLPSLLSEVKTWHRSAVF